MNVWLAVLMFSVIVAGAVVGCWASYHLGRFHGHIWGYGAGRTAERHTVSHRLNRALYQALEQGLITHEAMNRLYERAQDQIRMLGRDARASDRGMRQ